ncbi:MAG TPA: right-handed parallel beta-helix repeat-containing protein [Allosphingosinicella sp.]|jgi:hypothetical protein
MKLIRAALFAGLMMGGASSAYGQATRTWISGVGDDVNPCSRTAPCKTFAGAISKTAAGGEINAIDPGGYGTVTITKSITLDGLGQMTSLLANGATGITVNGAGIVVNIRNVTINCGSNAVGNGIRILQAAHVNIENVVIENCTGTGANGNGVVIATSAGNVRVDIRNVRFANLGAHGVHSNPTGGTVFLNVSDSSFVRGGTTAIQLRQLTNATIDRVTVTNHNPGAAVAAELTSVLTHISNSVFADNAFGVFNGNGGNPITRISNTVITRSTTSALQISGGSIISNGDNPIRQNAGNELPTSVEGPR